MPVSTYIEDVLKRNLVYDSENYENKSQLVLDAVISDIEEGNITDTVEQVVFNTIAGTGVISGIARGSNQTALAHKFYESTRAMFFEESKKCT